MRLKAILILSATSAGLAVGCGGPESATVDGQVTVDGKPLEKGVITFTPAGGNGATATASVLDGRYQLRTTPGTNRVQISAPVVVGKKKEYNAPNAPLVEITGESLPDRYHSKSELTFEVKSGSNTKDWQLESKTRKP